MKLKIIEHYHSETGQLRGYTVAYKPFPFIPYWKEFKTFYDSKEAVEHDVVFMMYLNDHIIYKEVYE